MLTAKAKTKSQSAVITLAQQIELLAALELERESRPRRHSLESLYQRLCQHASKLEITYPRLSARYNPREYLNNTRAILEAAQATLEISSEGSQRLGTPKPSRALTPRAIETRKKHFAFHAWKLNTWVRGATDPQKALQFAARARLYQALADAQAYPSALARVTRTAQIDLLLDASEADLQGEQAMSLLARADILPARVAEARAQLLALVPPQDEVTRLREEIAIHESCLARAASFDPLVAPLRPGLVELLVGQAHLREGQRALEVDAARGDVAALLAHRYPNASVVALESRPIFQALLTLKSRLAHFDQMTHRLETMPANWFDVVVLAHPTDEVSRERERLAKAYHLLRQGGKLIAVVSASAVAAWSSQERGQWYQWLMQVGARVETLSTRYGSDYARKPLYLVVVSRPDAPTDVLLKGSQVRKEE